ncbi:MAG: 50S ribosomal protein L13 [Candidatus Omnitrophica bacterium]|nr:50S ribosomal protein L13 [Candidatus Omnitrophota bacterium]MBU4478564.1 50S ribosomal protein L13 [Candidatus Omnitrophota bacterium]MCG2703563.1 50S ribosomal protein L13 [Candidatus Omnitrophota bacterium]
MKTFMQKPKDVKRKWHLVDADGKILGRVATKIAGILRGKTKAEYTPHVDMGDEVVVINAAKIRVTGKKLTAKKYQTYSGYPGGQKSFSLEHMLSKKPEEVIKHAVKGMLPHNSLGRQILKRLKVYGQSEHPHAAQNPQELKI